MANRFLKICDVVTDLPQSVVATAEPDGSVLTGDVGDLQALAEHCADVTIERV